MRPAEHTHRFARRAPPSRATMKKDEDTDEKKQQTPEAEGGFDWEESIESAPPFPTTPRGPRPRRPTFVAR